MLHFVLLWMLIETAQQFHRSNITHAVPQFHQLQAKLQLSPCVLCILRYRQNIFHNIVFYYCEIILVRRSYAVPIWRTLHLHYVSYLNRINKTCTNRGGQGLIALQYQGDHTSEDINVYPKREHLHSSNVNIQSSAYKNYNNYVWH
jgi:hypothetical protein